MSLEVSTLADIGKVLPVDLEMEMKRSYIDYAMSVIVQRALPDIRDGLKPVHRRILFAMHEDGVTPDKPYRKSARIVGDVLGRYHPHGDVAVYDAMVRLAQDFSIRCPLVDGHGNFGSVDGDPPAAPRYTEVRMAKIALELLRDLDKDTVDFVPNFDEELKEPTVLPSRFPNLLVNGASGIAVGMATNIPPHNLGEVIDGTIHLIDHPEATVADLMAYIKGPDFPTAGLILGTEGIRQAYETGRGIITMRAVAAIEPSASGRNRIIVTEIPYQVNKARLIEKIAELVREKRVDGITELGDESDRTGMRIVVTLRRDVNPNVVLNKLFKYTQLQQTFGIITLALVGAKPRLLTLREVLSEYVAYQKEVIVRRTRYQLNKAEERAHILSGLLIALDHLDEVIELIRSSKDAGEAKEGLMASFSLSEAQSQAILDLRLHRLTALERGKIESEFDELQKEISYLNAVLASDQMVLDIIKTELEDIKRRFADMRRTRIVPAVGELSDEDLIADEPSVVTMTHQGYIKRQPVTAYRAQKRGGRGISGMSTKSEDFVEHLFVTTTHHTLLFFTNLGRVYSLKVYELPDVGRNAKGTAIVNLLSLGGEERVTTIIPLPSDAEGFLFMATRLGTVKKTPVSDFQGIRSNGIIAIGLSEGDRLVDVRRTLGTEQIMLVTRQGMAIRFEEAGVRSMGRTAHGVRGMRLESDDQVVALGVVGHDGSEILLVTTNGFGKRTRVDSFRLTGRSGKGIRAMALTPRTGTVVAAALVEPDEQVMFVSRVGIVLRVAVDDISRQGRAARGVTLMRLGKDDHVVALSKIQGQDDEGDEEADET